MSFFVAGFSQPTTTHFLSGGGMLGSTALPLPFLLVLVGRTRVAHSPQYAYEQVSFNIPNANTAVKITLT